MPKMGEYGITEYNFQSSFTAQKTRFIDDIVMLKLWLVKICRNIFWVAYGRRSTVLKRIS